MLVHYKQQAIIPATSKEPRDRNHILLMWVITLFVIVASILINMYYHIFIIINSIHYKQHKNNPNDQSEVHCREG